MNQSIVDKFLALVLAAGMLLPLAACGGTPSSSAGTAGSSLAADSSSTAADNAGSRPASASKPAETENFTLTPFFGQERAILYANIKGQ